METKYKKALVVFESREIVVTFKKPQPYNDMIISGVADNFYRGAKYIRLYPDYRQKKIYLQINKEDFTVEDIERLHIENTLRLNTKHIKNLIKINENEIEHRKKKIVELQKELTDLCNK